MKTRPFPSDGARKGEEKLSSFHLLPQFSPEEVTMGSPSAVAH